MFLVTLPPLTRQFLPLNLFSLFTNDTPPQRPYRGRAPAMLLLGWPTCDAQAHCLYLR